MERREPDSRDFIRPQREFAEIVVRFHPDSGSGSDQADGQLNVHLVLRPSIPHPDLTYLEDHKNGQPGGIRLELGRDDGRLVEFLEVDGNVSGEQTAKLEQAIWKFSPICVHCEPIGSAITTTAAKCGTAIRWP